jgi:autotransporter adhesin
MGSTADGLNSIATGARSQASGGYSTATGVDSAANGGAASAYGAGSVASANNATAIGTGATAAGASSAAFGQGASATGVNATAIGQGSSAAHDNSTAIGQGVATTRANQVAIGNSRNTYTLSGITSAASAAAQVGPTGFVTTDSRGNLAVSNYGPASIAALDGRVSGLETAIGNLSRFTMETRREARQGIAAAMAMTSAPMPSVPGRTTWATNVATFRGEYAGGFSFAHRLNLDVPLAVTAGAAYSGGGNFGARVGLQGEF